MNVTDPDRYRDDRWRTGGSVDEVMDEEHEAPDAGRPVRAPGPGTARRCRFAKILARSVSNRSISAAANPS